MGSLCGALQALLAEPIQESKVWIAWTSLTDIPIKEQPQESKYANSEYLRWSRKTVKITCTEVFGSPGRGFRGKDSARFFHASLTSHFHTLAAKFEVTSSSADES